MSVQGDGGLKVQKIMLTWFVNVTHSKCDTYSAILKQHVRRCVNSCTGLNARTPEEFANCLVGLGGVSNVVGMMMKTN